MNDIERENDSEQADSERMPPEVGYCWQCGYDLRGLGTPRCPECGFWFEIEAVRELNADWCAERVSGMREASLAQALACGIVTLSLLTRGWAMLDTVKIAILGGALLMWLASYRLRGEIGTVFEEHRRVIIWGLGALILILILGGSGWQWSLAMLVGAMALGGLEVQWFLEGRRRGRLVGVTANWVETIWFSHRVNLALLAASGIAAAMVLAFGL